MHVKIEDLSPVEKKVAVEIPWPYVAQKLDDAYKDLSRGVALKGFRKGKVPRPMLERLYGRQVERDVVQQLVQESFIAAASQHKLQPVAEPVVDDAHLHKGESFHYSARVEVRAEITPKDYKGAKVERRAAKVADADVDGALQRKREELTEYKMIDGRDALAVTDVAVLSATGTLADKPFEKEGLLVDLSDATREPIPGIAQALVGTPIKAEGHALEWTVPAKAASGEDAPKELAGQKAALKITVRDAREKQMPGLDDEFAKDTGEADTLAELKEKMRERLLKDDEREVEQEVRQALVKEILRLNPFQVAPALVERQLDVMVHRAKLGMAMRGIDVRTAQIDEQKLRGDLKASAEDEVRAAFLIDAIADAEKVEVNEADMEKRLAEMAERSDKSVARLKADLQKEGRLEGLRYQVREEKTLDLLLSWANIEKKS